MRALALVAATALMAPVHAIEPEPADRLALFRLAERMDRAWTEADANANAELFDENATARIGNDPLGEGREAIRQQFRTFFKDRPAGLRHVTTIERIDQLSRDIAIWDAEVRVERQGAGGNWSTLATIRNVTIAVRQADGWRIRAVRAFPVD